MLNRGFPVFAAIALMTFAVTAARAGYVTPILGGGQVGKPTAQMKHADVSYDSITQTIAVTLDTSVATPVLRPLTPPDQFDPAVADWAVLTDKAYNWQWAWNPSGIFAPPAGSAIWIKRLSQTPGLEVYQRPSGPPQPPSGTAWPQIFQNDGDIWKWGGSMQHNAYAVLDPTRSSYSATYEVYLGDATTGVPLPGYGSDTVTWTWEATPVPEPATATLLVLGGLGAGARALRRKRRGEAT